MRTIKTYKEVNPHTFQPKRIFEFSDGKRVEFTFEILQDTTAMNSVEEAQRIFDDLIRHQVPDVSESEIAFIKSNFWS